MSYNNFGDAGVQPQQGEQDQGGFGAPGAQQQPTMGQQMDPSQQQNQFPGAQPGAPGAPGGQPGGDQKTTLWFVVPSYGHDFHLTLHRMGELEPWIDENFVRSVWFGMGYQVNVKMIRDKFSGSEITLLTVSRHSLTLS